MTDVPKPEPSADADPPSVDLSLVRLSAAEEGAITEPHRPLAAREETRARPLLREAEPRGGDAGEGGPAAAPAPKPPSRRGWYALLVVVFVLVAAAVGAQAWITFGLPKRLREEVATQAKARGLELSFDGVSATGILPWESGERAVQLTGVRLTNPDLPDVEIEAERVKVTLVGGLFDPKPGHLYVKDARVNARDIPSLVAVEKDAKSGRLSAMPVSIDGARLRIGRLGEKVPLTVIGEAKSIEIADGKVDFGGLTVEVPIPFVDVKVGPAEAELARKDGKSSVRVPSFLETARATVDDKGDNVHVELAPTDSTVLGKRLGMELQPMKVSGVLDTRLAGKGALEATFSLTMDGFVPPHPRELDGIVFGKKTKVSGKLVLEGSELLIKDVVIEAGSLNLKGGGKLTLEGGGRVTLSLKGNVGCAELASSAAGAHFGVGGSLLTGMLAKGRLGGSIGVHLEVDAQLSDMNHAKIAPSAYIGCKVSL